jgi:hypothetical protein
MKKSLVYITFLAFVFGLFAANSCDDSLEIKNDYGFTITHLPVPKRLKKGETAEIRLYLECPGKYSDARYYVRYFQPDGKGVLTLDGRTMLPNDGYELKKEEFRMYYTSQCEEQQVIDLTFYDSFKNQFELTFSFANEKVEKEEKE